MKLFILLLVTLGFHLFWQITIIGFMMDINAIIFSSLIVSEIIILILLPYEEKHVDTEI